MGSKTMSTDLQDNKSTFIYRSDSLEDGLDVELKCQYLPQTGSVKYKERSSGNENLIYSIEEVPPWYLCVLLGFQQYMTAFGSTISVPLILAGPLCVGSDYVGLSELISTAFFIAGIATLLQTTVGIRIPIIQGSTFAFLTPTIAILSLPEWKCPSEEANITLGMTNASVDSTGDRQVIWHSRIREVQGAVCIASLFQVIIGATGVLSVILRYVGPLTITPTITVMGLSLFRVAADKAATHWGISFATLCLIAIFSQYLAEVNVPFPSYNRGSGFGVSRLPVFKLFPILLSMLTAWLLCYILTISNAFPDNPSTKGYLARTDTRLEAIERTSWLRIPYPCQWGLPTVSAGAVFGMVAGVLASMIESVGDYYACARLSGAPSPPARAVNRGIMIEGICCILAGLIGSGNGTTSYSENVGAIGITRVGSRRVVQTTGVLLIIFGCVGKVGAVFITIPDPVIGGLFLAMFGMITAVGLSNLQYVDLNSTRNLFILATSIFLGMAIPDWVNRNPDSILIGEPSVRQIVMVLMTTSMFVGGAVGFFLDATIPGPKRDTRQREDQHDSTDQCHKRSEAGHPMTVYDIPYISRYLRRQRCTRYIPFCVDASPLKD